MRSRIHIAAWALILAGSNLACGGKSAAPDEAPGAIGRAGTLERVVTGPLPKTSMSPEQVRGALWEIAAGQRSGEAGRTLDEWRARAKESPTLENRFLAAAAIPDDDAQWKELRALLDEQPAFYWPRTRMAAIYASWKVKEHAEKELALADKLMPNNPYTRTVRGHVHRLAGDHQRAVVEYTAALEAFPGDAEARTGRALAKRELGEATQLRAELQRALKDLPTQYEAAETLAQLADASGQIPEARAAWEHVEKLAPKNREAKIALARLRGDFDSAGAIRALEGAAKLAPLSVEELKTLAALYRRAGRVDDEQRTVESLTKAEPKDAGQWRRLATLRERTRDRTGAQAAWRSLLQLEPGDGEAYLGLARAAEEQKKIREAMEYYVRAREAGEGAAQSALGRLREATLLPARSISGTSLAAIYRAASDSLEKAYEERLRNSPGIKGSLRMRLVPDAKGNIAAVESVDDTLGDPFLEAHLYFLLLEGRWPLLGPQERKPFILTFDLPPTKR